MKKIFALFCVLVLAVGCFGVVCFAADGGVKETVMTRIFEFYNTYNAEILEFAGTAIGFVFSTVILKALGKNKKKTDEIAGSQAGVVGGVNAVIDSNNLMVAAYNQMKSTYEQYGITEEDRTKYMGALIAQNTAILEILFMICSNNKNLPQGVKDIISLKYANCLGTVSDDNKVKAVIDGVKAMLSTGTEAEETEEGK